MTEKLRIGIVGVGAIAQVAHIPIWKKIDDVEIGAVCDTNKNKAQWVADKFGIPKIYDDPTDLFAAEDVDAIDICTPTHSHLELVTGALSAGKHVLVEKPMARNHEESVKMAQCAAKYGKQLMVAMNVRYRRDAMVLKKFTQNGELGDIFYGKTGWLRRRGSLVSKSWFAKHEMSGGGVFMDLGIQMLDVGLWLMGEPRAASVSATTYNNIGGLSVEDSAAVFVRLQNGATLTIEVSWTLLSDKDFFYTNLFGKHGGALLNPLRIHKELHGSLVNMTPAQEDSLPNLYKRSYENEIRHFKERIQNSSGAILSTDDDVERMRIVDAVYESARQGREIVLD